MRRRLMKFRLIASALPRFAAARRHAMVGQRMQSRSQGLQRHVTRLARRAAVLNRHALLRHSVAQRHQRAAFARAFAAGLR
jgi:hypothetical protein